MLPLLSTLALLLGLALTAFGWQGRVAHREPRCRACGYILTGISHTTRCTECGVNFIGANNPYIRETRAHRPALLWTGLPLTAISLGVLIVVLAEAFA